MKSLWSRRAAVAVWGLLLVVGSQTRAAPPHDSGDDRGRSGAVTPVARVAIIRLDFAGGLVEGSRELFLQRLVEGLKAAEFEVVSAPASGGVPSDYQVTGKVAASNKTYDITLELINGRTQRAIGMNHERCEICGVEEAGEKMALAASSLRARLEALTRTPARFVIRSRPAGAKATLDGQPAGSTPLDRELPAGPHKLTLAAAGYTPLERSFTAISGVDESLELELVRVPSTFPYRTAGWVAVATGAALLAAGIWAVAIDGDEIACAADERDRLGHCPMVRSSRLLGATLAGAGAVSATLGGVWLYLGAGGGGGSDGEATQARASRPRLSPGLVFRGTF